MIQEFYPAKPFPSILIPIIFSELNTYCHLRGGINFHQGFYMDITASTWNNFISICNPIEDVKAWVTKNLPWI